VRIASFSASGDCSGEAAPRTESDRSCNRNGWYGASKFHAHRTQDRQGVGEDIEKLAFNKAVARLYELVNTLAAPLSDVASGKADAEMIGSLQAGFADRAADRADDAASGGRMLEIAWQ
jgi:leucyl-tRNA synthetase